jgi:hypothetical protein
VAYGVLVVAGGRALSLARAPRSALPCRATLPSLLPAAATRPDPRARVAAGGREGSHMDLRK